MKIFYVYSHRDEGLRSELETHLALLRRQGFISGWHDRKLVPGQEWEPALLKELESSQVVLLLVSADFLASDFAYGREMKRALERHEVGEARVVPIMLRECDWENAPFAKLQGLPRDANPVTSWDNRDAAWTSVAKGIRQVVQELSVVPEHADSMPGQVVESGAAAPRDPNFPYLDLVSLRHRVTEQNSTWWRYSWLAEIRNTSGWYVSFDLSIDYLDEDGFVLDTGAKGPVTLAPHESRTVRNSDLLTSSKAPKVKTLAPSLRIRNIQ